MAENRRNPRVDTINLIAYLVLDNEGNKLSQGLGAAQNISPSGLLLKTTQMIDTQNISLLSNDPEDKLIEINGKVVYCRQIQPGNYETGIHFQGTQNENIQFVKSLVKVFYSRKSMHGCSNPENLASQHHA